jgi:hypothetical protein
LYVISLAVVYVLCHDFYRKTFSEKNWDLYGSKDSIGKPVMAIFFCFWFCLRMRQRWLVSMRFLWWAQLCQMCLNSEWFYRKSWRRCCYSVITALFCLHRLENRGWFNQRCLFMESDCCYNYCGGCR